MKTADPSYTFCTHMKLNAAIKQEATVFIHTQHFHFDTFTKLAVNLLIILIQSYPSATLLGLPR